MSNPSPRNITVVVDEAEKYYDGWIPEQPEEALAWLADRVAEIPKEFMHNAYIWFSTSCDYDGEGVPIVRIFYERPETEEEITARLNREKRVRDALEAQERQTLAALQAKYGGKP
jgi:hypothetical protein